MDTSNLCKLCSQKPKGLCKSCRSPIDPTTIVPMELWTTIFTHLDEADLLAVRLTCRSWKQIVDGCRSLRDRFRIDFCGLKALNRDYTPRALLPAAHADFGCCEILDVGHWWRGFGAGLVSLELNCCGVSLATLLEMLRWAGSLKELALIQVYYLEGVEVREVDFRMDGLESLTLHNNRRSERLTAVPSNLLELFRKLCPRLKHFAVGGDWNKKEVLQTFEALESTLEGIRFDATNKLLRALSMTKQLKLRQVEIKSLTRYNSVVLGFFFQAQRNITDLTVCSGAIAFLNQAEFRQLKLTRLCVNVGWQTDLRTTEMPTLKHLVVSGSSECIVLFGHCKLTGVEVLDLIGINPSSFTNYLVSCSGLRTLILDRVTIGNGLVCAGQNFSSLRTLKLNLLHIPRRVLLQLFERCPNLEQLELISVWCVNDDIVLKLCQSLKSLKWLTISCKTSKASVDHIINHHGDHLRQLDFNQSDMSDGIRKKLLNHFTPWCRVNFTFSTRSFSCR